MNGQQQQKAIEDERAKAVFTFKEDIFPGFRLEMDLKKIFVSTQSAFQKIDVIETIYGKTLITDGKTQSSQFDEHVYHETLVHPAMLKVASTGNPPKTVFIGGGGELATAREVLRYNCVERVVMVDLDEKVVEVSKQYLPEWGGDKVVSDSRLELVIGDAYAYLMNTQEKFDVIIMDISDPIEAGPGVMLYTQEFYDHSLTRLNLPHGAFVTQSGMAESVPMSIATGGIDPSCFAPIYNTLRVAFDCVVPYSINLPSYGSDWGFNMAFQCGNGNKNQGVQHWKNPTTGQIDELIEKYIDGGADSLQSYDEQAHGRMFSLTKPLRKSMNADARIITKENPIYMY